MVAFGQFHNFWLASDKDALYSAGGAVLRKDPTGNSGSYVGSEIDLAMSAQLSTHSNVLIGWSKLFSGGFIEKTGPTYRRSCSTHSTAIGGRQS